MPRILLVQGANLSDLGRREPQFYGTTRPAELDARLQAHARRHGYELEIVYTNCEGEAIDHISRAGFEEDFDGLVMNPGGFVYAGYALRDCVKGTKLPYVEVHISQIFVRGIPCVLSEVASGVVIGFGLDGYELALDAMLRILAARAEAGQPAQA